jgi:regulator of cell morphogenesis and NO signaling
MQTNTSGFHTMELKHNRNYNSFHSAALGGSIDLHALDFHALVKLIVTQYHYKLKDQASLIYDLSNTLFRSDGYLYPHLSNLVERFFMFFHDLLYQFKKEEQILFPNIIDLAEKRLHEGAFNYGTFGMVTEYAGEMKKQHGYILENISAFRDITGDYKIIEGDCRSYMNLMDAMKTFEREVIEHINLESEVLIPRAIKLSEK